MKKKKIQLGAIKITGLRRRWLVNTVAVACALGLVCVLLIMAFFAAHYYSSMESDMRHSSTLR